MPSFPFDNSYSRLPEQFYRRCLPTAAARPSLIRFNDSLAAELGVTTEGVGEEGLAQLFSGNQLPEGADPIATVYAGHQFGGFNPQLGDGRAILLGEVVNAEGRRLDIQLKGAGRTPWSRGGDGRSPLGPVLREYLVSEAMHALGVPTTRALAAVTTGEMVFRDQPLPGAILTRVAASHIRVGTFQFFAARREHEALRILADHVIERHYPQAAASANPYLALLQGVIEGQASLVAHWMAIGFVHGVMNTDNVTVSGETIDFGPCAFLDVYDPATVFSSIDTGGRYAYQMQPAIAQWNMARFAETLLPLLSEDEASAVTLATDQIKTFVPVYQQAWLTKMRAKLGLLSEQTDDEALIEQLLTAMTRNRVDFTRLFRYLCDAVVNPLQAEQCRALFTSAEEWDSWAVRWQQRLEQPEEQVQGAVDVRRQQMRNHNPSVIPRNHRIERCIENAVERQDFSDFHRLMAIFSHPYDDHLEANDWLGPPPPSESVCTTFCGT